MFHRITFVAQFGPECLLEKSDRVITKASPATDASKPSDTAASDRGGSVSTNTGSRPRKIRSTASNRMLFYCILSNSNLV